MKKKERENVVSLGDWLRLVRKRGTKKERNVARVTSRPRKR